MNARNASPVPGRFRRQVTSLMLVLSLSMGAVVATPTRAHAAASTYVVAQFSISNNFPVLPCFSCMSDVGGATVEIMLSLDGLSWYHYGSGYYKLTNVGTFAVETTGFEWVYFAMRVNYPTASARFISSWVMFYPYDRNTYTSPRRMLVNVW